MDINMDLFLFTTSFIFIIKIVLFSIFSPLLIQCDVFS